jgi:hypothetical protein
MSDHEEIIKSLNRWIEIAKFWETLYKTKTAAIMREILRYHDSDQSAQDCITGIDEIVNAEG